MFSIIIPYYKKREYIERCLDSVLAQTFNDYEIILVDDGSQDDITKLIHNKYQDKVKLIIQKNQGVSVARNTGIANATQPYIAFLDADDCWHSQYLEFASKIINNNTDVKIVGSHYSRDKKILENSYDEIKNKKIDHYFRVAVQNTLFLTSATIVKRSFFDDNSRFNPNLKRGEDIDVWLRTVASGGNVFYVENTLVYYSDEDVHQATASIGNVENTLVGVINEYYKPLIEKINNPDFSTFVSKYVYFNLYPYYFSTTNHNKAKRNLKQNKYYYFFLHLPYYLPLSVGQKIVSNKKLNRYLRMYLKFFLRKVY
ncbi:MAG: glycosyltransferase family 2 protein [Chryseobacterium sp.]|nr:glycosyltransferase family 2 protein [Chryseobacterium sp.]